MGNDACPETDILIVEATKKQYALWKREQNAHAYLAKYESMVQIESLDDTSGGEGELPLHERLGDDEVDVERTALAAVLSEQLARGLQNLPPEEAALLCSYYVHRKTAREIAGELGISQQAVLKDGRVMEYVPSGQVLEDPRDSYTRQLLNAVPKLRRA